jgi:predicted nucleotidyltransferase component of viral defense system
MAKDVRNVGASVRARLLALSKTSGQPFDVLLTRFVLERLLYRLSRSPYAKAFVLKGAMLLATWEANPHRVTRDLDLLGFGDSEAAGMLKVFGEVLALADDDGVVFDLAELKVDQIREELEYGGLRLKTRATIGGARVPVVVDIGFGDAIAPGLEEIEYPALLDFPAPKIRAYARETVIAEKFQAMVMLGRANSRMKDFHDIWVLSRNYAFDGERLAQAIKATFERRKTDIPEVTPDALTQEFANDSAKQQQWRAFVEDVASNPGPLTNVCADLETFLMPHAQRARTL